MGNTKVKCKSCGNEFIGDEYTFSCPSCGGDSLVIIKAQTFGERLKNLLYTNRIVAGVLVFSILVLGFLLLPSGNKKGDIDQSINVLTFKKEKDHIEIIITRHSQEDLNEKEVLDFDNNKLYYSECRFKAFSPGSVEVKIIDGKIYPCSDGLITIIWDNNKNLFRNTSNKYTSPKKIINDFKLPMHVASQYAECRESLKLSVTKNENCQITIETNYDTLYRNLKVWISVDGKKGTYKHQNDWTFDKNNKKFDIWGYVEYTIDTVQPDFNETGSALGCNPMNKSKIKNAAIALGTNPKNFEYGMRLMNALDSKGTVYVNGRESDNFSDILMWLDMDFTENKVPFVTKCRFNLDGESVNIYFTN